VKNKSPVGRKAQFGCDSAAAPQRSTLDKAPLCLWILGDHPHLGWGYDGNIMAVKQKKYWFSMGFQWDNDGMI